MNSAWGTKLFPSNKKWNSCTLLSARCLNPTDTTPLTAVMPTFGRTLHLTKNCRHSTTNNNSTYSKKRYLSTLLKMTTIMKIKNLFSFLLVLCLLFSCQTSQQVLHRSKPLRVLESHAEYTPDKNQTFTETDKGIETHIEEAQSQTAASSSEQPQTLALPLTHVIKPLTTEPYKIGRAHV